MRIPKIPFALTLGGILRGTDLVLRERRLYSSDQELILLSLDHEGLFRNVPVLGNCVGMGVWSKRKTGQNSAPTLRGVTSTATGQGVVSGQACSSGWGLHREGTVTQHI